jgi:TPR repeat protein
MNKFIFSILISVVLFYSPMFALADDYQAGMKTTQNGDYKTAFNLWKPLAHQGYAIAQYNIGYLYLEGLGVAKDCREAIRSFISEANHCVDSTHLNLVYLYYNG